MHPSNLIGRKELAEYLSVSLRFADQLASGGDIPRIKIGRRTFFSKLDVERYLARIMREQQRLHNERISAAQKKGASS